MFEDADVIDVYTLEDAIEDGVIADLGLLFNRRIVMTSNMMAKLGKEELLKALIRGLKEASRLTRPDLISFQVNGRRVWVDDTGEVLTFMLPEDY